MNYKKLILMVAVAFITTLALGGERSAFARTYSVDDDRRDCPNAQYTSIQAAVNNALAGDSIRVCPGLYQERVRINAGKNNLTLFATVRGEAVIQAPASLGADPYAIVRINGAQNIVFRDFTVAGPLPDALFCSTTDVRAGLAVIGGGSATIRDNVFRDIRSTSESLRNCFNGVAVAVGNPFTGDIGTATIVNNFFERYQAEGILVNQSGSSATIDGNDLRGISDSPTNTPQNGIEVSDGATGEVRNNKVEDHRFPPQTVGSSGIITSNAGRVRIINNQANRNDFGIISAAETNPLRVSQNLTTYNTFDGISLYSTTGAVIKRNSSYSNGFDGIYLASDATGNTIRRNNALFNLFFDAQDDSGGGGTGGTANTWLRNRCDTDNKNGDLCTADDADTGVNDSPILLNGTMIRTAIARPLGLSFRR